MTRTSIIIPTYKRPRSVVRLLSSIIKELSDNDELIICEQGPSNVEAYSNYLSDKRVRYFHLKNIGTSNAKNFGASRAKGKYLIFFDDDVVLKKNVIPNLVKNFNDSSIGAVGGRVLTPGQKNKPFDRSVGRISFFGHFSDAFSSEIKKEIDTVIGCNCAWDRDTFNNIGGFDIQFTGAIREDSDLSLRTKYYGKKVIFEPKAVVVHMRYPTGGGRKSEGRLNWYYNFLSNETYFFLKHRPAITVPIILLLRAEWICRCMFGFGREVSLNSILTPWSGIANGINKYLRLKDKCKYYNPNF